MALAKATTPITKPVAPKPRQRAFPAAAIRCMRHDRKSRSHRLPDAVAMRTSWRGHARSASPTYHGQKNHAPIRRPATPANKACLSNAVVGGSANTTAVMPNATVAMASSQPARNPANPIASNIQRTFDPLAPRRRPAAAPRTYSGSSSARSGKR